MTHDTTRSRGRASPFLVRGGGFVAAGVLTLAFGAFAQGTTLYVDDDAPMDGKGTSWVSPLRYLSDALELANGLTVPVEIRVAQGVYAPHFSSTHPIGNYDRTASFEIPAGMTLRGGYAGIGSGDPNERDPDVYVTTLTGDLKRDDPPQGFKYYRDNSHHVVTVLATFYSAETLIDGVTITGGNAMDAKEPRGGAVLIGLGNGNVTFNACRVVRNRAEFGGGIYAEWAYPLVITNSVFTGNAAKWSGGAVHTGTDAWGIMVNAAFTENTAGFRGGAYFAGYEGATDGVNCSFRGNQAKDGGAIYNDCNLPMNLTNCEFAANTATWRGGAMSSSDTFMTITNVSAACNRADEGGAFFFGDSFYQDEVAILNSIFYHNEAAVGSQIAVGPGDWGGDGSGLLLVLDDVDVQFDCGGLGVPSGWLGALDCRKVFDEDPLFVLLPATPEEWRVADLELQDISPCIDAARNSLVAAEDVFDLDGDGITNEPTPMDLLGARRIVDAVDHGAFEQQTCQEDLSGDAVVSTEDMHMILSPKVWDTTAWPEDLDGNGRVGWEDLNLVLTAWGPCAEPTSEPVAMEPAVHIPVDLAGRSPIRSSAADSGANEAP